jgi:hypothetical protein
MTVPPLRRRTVAVPAAVGAEERSPETKRA